MIPTGVMQLWKPKRSDLTLCVDAMHVLLSVANELPSSQRPRRLTVISTTGIDDEKTDIPVLFLPMYH